MMVNSRSSPPSTSFSGDCASCSTNVGDMYWANAERICRRCACSRAKLVKISVEIDRCRRQQGIGEVDQQPVVRIEYQDVPISSVASSAPTVTSVTGPTAARR